MTAVLLLILVFAACFLIGFGLISKVPPLLHTPLMSMTNAISAVTILGALLVFSLEAGSMQKAMGGLAIAMATFNLVGGFAITDRMLRLFRSKPSDREGEGESR